MIRVIAVLACFGLVASGCGGGGGNDPDGPVQVGGGLSVRDRGADGTAPSDEGAGTPDPGAPGAAGAPASGAPGEQSPHPTTASGQVILNATVREADGFHVQLTVDQAVGYEGDLIFDLTVTNQRDHPVWYEPGSADGALVKDRAGQVVWRNGPCGGVSGAFGHVKLDPGKATRLTYQYDRDGGGDESCALGSGRYEVFGQFHWCTAEQLDGEQCSQLSVTGSHPVTVTLEES